MPRTDFSAMHCSIARSLAALGDGWGPLIVRDVFVGITRFDDLQRDLGIARNVLTARLNHLVHSGVIEARPYQQHPVRSDYVLTAKGGDLVPAILALMAWGDRWTAGDAGPPARLHHDTCDHRTSPVVACSSCGEQLRVDALTPLAGPGGVSAPGTRVMAERLSPRP